MGMGRANQIGIGLARQVHVVGVFARPSEKARVFAPPKRFADPLRRDLLPGMHERHRSPNAQIAGTLRRIRDVSTGKRLATFSAYGLRAVGGNELMKLHPPSAAPVQTL